MTEWARPEECEPGLCHKPFTANMERIFGDYAGLSPQVLAMDSAHLPWTYRPDIGVHVAEPRDGQGLGAYVYALVEEQVNQQKDNQAQDHPKMILRVVKSNKSKEACIAEAVSISQCHMFHFRQTILAPFIKEYTHKLLETQQPEIVSEDDEAKATDECMTEAVEAIRKRSKSSNVGRSSEGKKIDIAHLERRGWKMISRQRVSNGRVDKSWEGPCGQRARSVVEALAMCENLNDECELTGNAHSSL